MRLALDRLVKTLDQWKAEAVFVTAIALQLAHGPVTLADARAFVERRHVSGPRYAAAYVLRPRAAAMLVIDRERCHESARRAALRAQLRAQVRAQLRAQLRAQVAPVPAAARWTYSF